MYFELIVVGKLILALLLGAFIGYDRETHGSDAGIRTYAAVCIGASIFTAIAAHIVDDPGAISRVIANIVTGVGFLGAGIIYKNNNQGASKGLTTAATVWCTAAVGVAVGLNLFAIALASTVILYFLLSLHHQKWYLKWKQKVAGKHLDKDED